MAIGTKYCDILFDISDFWIYPMPVAHCLIPPTLLTFGVVYLLLLSVIRLPCSMVYFATMVVSCLALIQSFVAPWAFTSRVITHSSCHTPIVLWGVTSVNVLNGCFSRLLFQSGGGSLLPFEGCMPPLPSIYT